MKYKQYLKPDELTRKMSGRDYVRELVRQRDGRQCQDCGKKWKIGMRRLDVHHLDGLCGKKSLQYDRIEDMRGLITLCHKCHFNHPEHVWAINDSFIPSRLRKPPISSQRVHLKKTQLSTDLDTMTPLERMRRARSKVYKSERLKQITALLQKHYTQARIANELGISSQRVSQIIQQSNLSSSLHTKRFVINEEIRAATTKEELSKLIKSGLTQVGIARKLHAPKTYIYRLIIGYGIRT